MKDLLKEYYSTQRNSFQQHLRVAGTEKDEENIHQLRLSVKRMRALFTFLHFLSGSKTGRKPLKALKKIYRPAGEIRDTQVQLAGLAGYEKRLDISYDAYRQYLIRTEKTTLADLREAIASFSTEPLDELADISNKILDGFTETQLKEKASEIFDHKLKRVSELHKLPTNKDKNLHEIRKILKEARYLLNIFSGEISDFGPLKLSYDRLREIEKTLGKWHDQVNAEIFLKSFLKKSEISDEGEIMRYKILAKSIRRYKLSLQKRIELAFKYELEI